MALTQYYLHIQAPMSEEHDMSLLSSTSVMRQAFLHVSWKALQGVSREDRHY